MPKSSQKAAGADQPTNQRGKSRFGTSGRPGRVVLPERPPRVVDNEIVSILLGADPAALTAQHEEVPSITQPEPVNSAPALAVVEAPPLPDMQPAEALTKTEPSGGDTETTAVSVERVTADGVIIAGAGLTSRVPVDTEAVSAPLNASPADGAPLLARVRRAPLVPTTRRSDESATPAVQGGVSRDGAISSFGEFVERWKHGLRKGQLKICEVLYQKTYAVGQTECVTSFSELGRLSGLKMRQCFNIIAQLEALRFVERSKSAVTSNKKDQGSVIRLHLYPFK